MNEPMHIALISRYYPPDPGGGLAIYTQQIAQNLVEKGHEVTVIAASPQGLPWEGSGARVDWHNGVRLIRIPQLKTFKRSLSGATFLYNSDLIGRTLTMLHQGHSLDVIHAPATFFESYAYGRRLKNTLGVPLVLKFHENQETYQRFEGRLQWVKRLRRKTLGQYMRRAALDADFHLGVSRHALASSRDYLGLSAEHGPAAVSPSPIDLSRFAPLPGIPPEGVDRQGVLAKGEPYIFYSGRLIHEKGLHLLVEAFLSVVSEMYPDMRLVIAGEFDYRQPDYEAKIRRMLAGHMAAGRVVFTGRIPYEQMPWWYSRCRLFVGPSFCEPLGRTFLEAMACEAPVIAFNSGGPQEFIQHAQNGYLVNTQAVWSLGQAMLTLLAHPDFGRELGHYGRKTVAQNYHLDTITGELVQIYRQVAHRIPHRTHPAQGTLISI